MKKETKAILRYLVGKELKAIEADRASIEFPELDFLKSVDVYEKELKEIDKNL